MKIVLNKRYGGFSLSEAAYERLIELGIPVRAYEEEPRDPVTGLYSHKPKNNEGEVIFDTKLSNDREQLASFGERYWDAWTSNYDKRNHSLVVQVVEELGEKANGPHADLQIEEIPDNSEYTIDDYDGIETVES